MYAVLFSPIRGQPWHSVTLAALGALVIAAVFAVRPRMPVTLFFLAGYLTIVVIWPFAPSRFLWAIWPMFLLLVWPARIGRGDELRRPGSEDSSGSSRCSRRSRGWWLATRDTSDAGCVANGGAAFPERMPAASRRK